MLRFCREPHGGAQGPPAPPAPAFSPIRGSNGAAFEEWLLRACMEADGSHLAQQAAHATGATGATGAHYQAKPGRVHRDTGHTAPWTGSGCNGSGACPLPTQPKKGRCPDGLREETTPLECQRKPGSLWSAVLSEASTDSRRTLGLDSSSSEEGEGSVASKLQLRRALVSPTEGLPLPPQTLSVVVSRSPLHPAPRPRTPKAPRAGQRPPPLVAGEKGTAAGSGRADGSLGEILQALAYPLTAFASVAGAIMEVVQDVLPLLADDQWLDSSDGSDSTCGCDEVEIEERAHARSIHGWGPQGGPKRDTTGAVAGAAAGAGVGTEAGDADTWEDVLRKRRASRALNRFLDLSRVELCANRLFVDRAETASAAAPLWQRRQWKRPPSLCMVLRSSQAPAVTQNQVMEHLCTPPAPPCPDAGTPGASPLWQRRASRAPTPLGLKFRKPPPSLGGVARQRTLGVPAA